MGTRVGIVAMAVVGLSLGGSGAIAQQAAADSQIARTKAALAKYADPIAAVHDGYFSTLGCIEFPAGNAGDHGHMPYKPGGMGVHFFNTALLGPTVDPLHPQVLIYEPNGDKLQLVAAEWLVPVAVGIKEAPSVFGHALEGPMEGHAPIMPEELAHWDLHVWLWKNNPYGMFSPTNPNLKCPKGPYSYAEAVPKKIGH